METDPATRLCILTDVRTIVCLSDSQKSNLIEVKSARLVSTGHHTQQSSSGLFVVISFYIIDTFKTFKTK